MKEKILDPTGIELTPGHSEECKGAKPETCCCDECNFFLDCFPEWKKFVFENPQSGIK